MEFFGAYLGQRSDHVRPIVRMGVDGVPMKRDAPQLLQIPQLEHLFDVRNFIPVEVCDLQVRKFRNRLENRGNLLGLSVLVYTAQHHGTYNMILS